MQSSQLFNQLRNNPEFIQAEAKWQLENGEIAMGEHRYRDALNYFQMALKNLKDIAAKPDDISPCYEKLGNCYFELAKTGNPAEKKSNLKGAKKYFTAMAKLYFEYVKSTDTTNTTVITGNTFLTYALEKLTSIYIAEQEYTNAIASAITTINAAKIAFNRQPDVIAKHLLSLARCYALTSNFEKARQCYNDAYRLYKEMNAYKQMDEIFYILQATPVSFINLELSQEEIQKLNKTIKAELITADNAFAQKDYVNSIKIYQEILKKCREADATAKFTFKCHIRIALCYLALEQLASTKTPSETFSPNELNKDSAIECAKSSFKKAILCYARTYFSPSIIDTTSAEVVKGLLFCYEELKQIYINQNKTQKVIHYIKKTIELRKAARDYNPVIAKELEELILIYRDQFHDYKNASRYLKELAYIYRDQFHDYKNASRYFKTLALIYRDQLHDHENASLSFKELGLIYRDQLHDYKNALRYLEEALRLYPATTNYKKQIKELSSLIKQIKTYDLNAALSKLAQEQSEESALEQKQSEENTQKETNISKPTPISDFNKPTMRTSIGYEYPSSRPAPNPSAPLPILSMFSSFIKPRHLSTPDNNNNNNNTTLTSSSIPTLSG